MASAERPDRSYKKYRPLLFGAVIFVAVLVLGNIAYTDFLSPDQSVNQPAFNSLPPSTPQKTDAQKAAYSVPADHPRNIRIDKLGIDANIVQLGTLKNGMLDAPKTAWDAGWYDASGLPGKPGAMVIDGHVNDIVGTPGVFYALHTLTKGDHIQIERGDHESFSFEVVSTEQVPTAGVDMNKVLRPAADNTEGLNLITCGGTYEPKKQTYDQRVIVYSKRTS